MCLVDLYVFVGLTGVPGLTRADVRFSTLFPHRFFDVFLMVLASILDDFFDDFPMFFASLFRHLFSCFLKFSESIFKPYEP